jgi:signal peptidase II
VTGRNAGHGRFSVSRGRPPHVDIPWVETAAPIGNDDAVPSISRFLPWILTLATGVVAADQLSKWWAESALTPGQTTPVIGEILEWRLVYNAGAAFGLGAEYTWVLTAFAGLAVVALGVLATRVLSPAWAVGVGVLLGGVTSHLGDRLLRAPGFARGQVVDFIAYNRWFIGNVADIAIVGGAAFLAILTLLGMQARPDTAGAAG